MQANQMIDGAKVLGDWGAMKALQSRLSLWLILAIPGAWMLLRWGLTPQEYGYGHAIADSGDWAAWLLLMTLAVTPIRLAFRKHVWAQWLMRRRRDLGVASFAYALGHTVIYLWRKNELQIIGTEAVQIQYLTGWIAFALFVPLAVTSNDVSMRSLKRNWKRLHRFVYPAAVLTFLHWALTAFEPMTAYIHIGILAAIEIVRIILQRRQSVTYWR